MKKDLTKTPCVGNCTTATFDEICKGCGRTAKEVIEWNSYSDEIKIKINQRLQKVKSLNFNARFNPNKKN